MKKVVQKCWKFTENHVDVEKTHVSRKTLDLSKMVWICIIIYISSSWRNNKTCRRSFLSLLSYSFLFLFLSFETLSWNKFQKIVDFFYSWKCVSLANPPTKKRARTDRNYQVGYFHRTDCYFQSNRRKTDRIFGQAVSMPVNSVGFLSVKAKSSVSSMEEPKLAVFDR